MIHRLFALIRPVPVGVLLSVFLLTSAAFGQEEPVGPQDNSSWVLGYALTVLGIVLGLVAVCRPGNRSSEIRIEDE